MIKLLTVNFVQLPGFLKVLFDGFHEVSQEVTYYQPQKQLKLKIIIQKPMCIPIKYLNLHK